MKKLSLLLVTIMFISCGGRYITVRDKIFINRIDSSAKYLFVGDTAKAKKWMQKAYCYCNN